MMKKIFLLPVFIAFFTISKAQFDTSFAKMNLLRCADSMAQGFRSKDWEKLARYSYPAMIGRMGGKKGFIDYLSQQFTQVPDSAWKRYEPGKILQVIKTEKDLQAVIEHHSVLEWQGMRISSVSCLVGESWSAGVFWTFFDPQGDVLAAKVIKPDLSNEIIIPGKNEKMEPLDPPSANHKNKTPLPAKN